MCVSLLTTRTSVRNIYVQRVRPCDCTSSACFKHNPCICLALLNEQTCWPSAMHEHHLAQTTVSQDLSFDISLWLIVYVASMANHSADEQMALAKMWMTAREGTLRPWSEAKAWALREVYLESRKGQTWGLNAWVSKRLKKVGGEPPSRAAIEQFFAKID